MTVNVPAEALEPKKDGVIRVLIGLPHEGMTGSEAYANRLSNFKHLGMLESQGKFEFLHYTCGRMHVFFAREEMAKQAINANCDYLYMIDDDMICPNDMFERLYADDKPIVGPLAFTRNFPHKPVIYSCIEGWDAVSQKDYFSNYAVMNYPKEKLAECDAIGFGAVLIKTEVLRAVATPRFMSTCGTGEDILFCYKAKKAGYATWVDTRVKLGHVSHPIIVTEDYVQAQWKAHGMEVERTYGPLKTKAPVLVLGD